MTDPECYMDFPPIRETRDVPMTMLDQFAMAAMQGDWASQCPDFGQLVTLDDEGLVRQARYYYRMANAMLKVRAEQERSAE